MNTRQVLAMTSMFASCAFAQDFVSVTPNATVLKDDGKVRVIDYRAKAGDKLPMHSHPYMVVYLLEGGSTQFTLPDGRTYGGSSKTGAVLFNGPVTHSQEHITDSHAILVEIAEGAKFNAPQPAGDILAVASDHCKLLLENDKVRVFEFTAKKGDKVARHSHPAHVVYLIKAGQTQFTLENGSRPQPGSPKDGDALINPPVTHSQEHLEEVRGIIVDLK